MWNKRLALILVSGMALLALTACNAAVINGSGNLVTETREVSGFDSIDLSGSGEVIITQGSGETLTVETDDNVMEHVESEVRNGTLHLGFKPGINLIDVTQLVFTVGVDDLTAVSVSGSGDVETDQLSTDRLDLKVSGSGDVQIGDLATDELTIAISGSGDIDLAGQATIQDIAISGSGKYQAGDLASQSVNIDISGSGTATVWASETLDADISGSGTVNYYGRPAVDSSQSGSGDLNSLGEKQG